MKCYEVCIFAIPVRSKSPRKRHTYCTRCGATLGPYATVKEDEGCSRCKGKKFHLDTGTPLRIWTAWVRALIHKFKYANHTFLCQTLNEINHPSRTHADCSGGRYNSPPACPLGSRVLYRGFNQSGVVIPRHSKPLNPLRQEPVPHKKHRVANLSVKNQAAGKTYTTHSRSSVRACSQASRYCWLMTC